MQISPDLTGSVYVCHLIMNTVCAMMLPEFTVGPWTVTCRLQTRHVSMPCTYGPVADCDVQSVCITNLKLTTLKPGGILECQDVRGSSKADLAINFITSCRSVDSGQGPKNVIERVERKGLFTLGPVGVVN